MVMMLAEFLPGTKPLAGMVAASVTVRQTHTFLGRTVEKEPPSWLTSSPHLGETEAQKLQRSRSFPRPHWW